MIEVGDTVRCGCGVCELYSPVNGEVAALEGVTHYLLTNGERVLAEDAVLVKRKGE